MMDDLEHTRAGLWDLLRAIYRARDLELTDEGKASLDEAEKLVYQLLESLSWPTEPEPESQERF
jgi:hypothetical protein